MKFNISPMTLSDLAEIKETLTQDFDDFWSVSLLQKELENKYHLSSYYFVAKQGKEIVGFCGVTVVLDTFELLNIVTKNNKRNIGIASSMLSYLIEFAKNLNIKVITLEVNEHNLPAIALYQKYHFQQVGIRKKYYHGKDNAILMNLSL